MSGGGKNEVKETAAEKAAAEVAMKQWTIYKDDLQKFEHTFMKRVDNLNTTQNMKGVKAGVDLNYNKNFSNARGAATSKMAGSGLNPNSGKFQDSLSSLSLDQAIGQGDTINRSQVGEQDRYMAGLGDIAAIGMGQKAEAMAGLGDVATQANKKAISDAENAFNRSSANQQLAGAAVGVGGEMYVNQAGKPPPPPQNFTKDQVTGITPSPYDPYKPLLA